MNNKHNPKHQNQVRITSGELGGRKIHFQHAEGLRPTPDMVREKLFNWLGQDLTGWCVLDVFSGSGVLSFEAVSRHAKSVDACEMNAKTAQTIQQYIQTFACAEKMKLHQQNGLQFLQQTSQKYDLVFLDPPFAWQDWQTLLQMLPEKLNPQAFVYLEAGKLPDFPSWLNIYRQGKAGQSQFVLLQYQTLCE